MNSGCRKKTKGGKRQTRFQSKIHVGATPMTLCWMINWTQQQQPLDSAGTSTTFHSDTNSSATFTAARPSTRPQGCDNNYYEDVELNSAATATTTAPGCGTTTSSVGVETNDPHTFSQTPCNGAGLGNSEEIFDAGWWKVTMRLASYYLALMDVCSPTAFGKKCYLYGLSGSDNGTRYRPILDKK